MRQGRFITTAVAAVAILAIGPAAALATPASFTDDTVGDFGTGTHDPAISVADPGLRLTRTMMTEQFDGPSLPANLVADPSGAATLAPGFLTVNAGAVSENRSYDPGQVLEFRADFTGTTTGMTEAFQHAGFAASLSAGPWAIFSTGGTAPDLVGFYARTLDASGVAINTPLPVPTGQHLYRIEWSAGDVKFYVDGVLVVRPAVAIAPQMRPMVSDVDVNTPGVILDSVGLELFPAAGSFESKVRDAGAGIVTWGALTAPADKPTATSVTFETRTGQTPNAGDATWSAYQSVGSGGPVPSPSARYIQYRATLGTTDNRVAPSLDKVQIDYNVDTSPTVGAGGTGSTAGTGSTSPASGGSSAPAVDKTKPKVSFVAKSLRASKKGAVSFSVGCPATEKSCKVTLKLKNGTKTLASKSVTVKGGKTKTVTLQLNTATRQQLSKRGSLKVSAVVAATDAAGNKKTTTKRMTLRRAAA